MKDAPQHAADDHRLGRLRLLVLLAFPLLNSVAFYSRTDRWLGVRNYLLVLALLVVEAGVLGWFLPRSGHGALRSAIELVAAVAITTMMTAVWAVVVLMLLYTFRSCHGNCG